MVTQTFILHGIIMTTLRAYLTTALILRLHFLRSHGLSRLVFVPLPERDSNAVNVHKLFHPLTHIIGMAWLSISEGSHLSAFVRH